MSRKGWIITVSIFLAAVVIVLVGKNAELDRGLPETYRSVIDGYEADGNCAALQNSFDDTNDRAKLQYIDDALEDAGCYDD